MMDLSKSVELLMDSGRIAETLAATTPAEDRVVFAGRNAIEAQLLRGGEFQAGRLSNADRAAIIGAGKVIARVSGTTVSQNPRGGDSTQATHVTCADR